jgi:hypothetical protein
MEAWIEANLDPNQPQDWSLLTDVVDGLVHERFGGEIENWHYFWEPALRFRIRWRDPSRAPELSEAFRAALDGAKAEGRFKDWVEGLHGESGKAYTGEANFYGEEVWPQIQKDWTSSSELALLLIKLGRNNALTRESPFHWERRVHLFSNQLFGSLDAEIQLCLTQALGYLRKLEAGGVTLAEPASHLANHLQSFLGRSSDPPERSNPDLV